MSTSTYRDLRRSLAPRAWRSGRSGVSLGSLVFRHFRLAWGGNAQPSHFPRDCTGLTPGAMTSSDWTFQLRCWLHEEGILLGRDDIPARHQRGRACVLEGRRGNLRVGLLTEIRGFWITTPLIISHLHVSGFLLRLFRKGLHLASLLLLHPAVLEEDLIRRHGPLYGSEGSPEGVQSDAHLPTLRGVRGQLPGHSCSINLPTQRGLPLATVMQGGGGFVTLGVKLLLVLSEDLGDHILEG